MEVFQLSINKTVSIVQFVTNQKIHKTNTMENQETQDKIEIMPGKYANEGQAAVIRAIRPWLGMSYTQMSSEADMFRLIEGGAGVGKTTVTNCCLQGARGKVIGAAVSDEARGILQLSMIGRELTDAGILVACLV